MSYLLPHLRRESRDQEIEDAHLKALEMADAKRDEEIEKEIERKATRILEECETENGKTLIPQPQPTPKNDKH